MTRVGVCIAMQVVETAFFFAIVGAPITGARTVAIARGCPTLTEAGVSLSIGVGVVALALTAAIRGFLTAR